MIPRMFLSDDDGGGGAPNAVIEGLTDKSQQKAGGGGLDVNAKVKVGDREITISEMIQAVQESDSKGKEYQTTKEGLTTMRKRVRTLLRGEGSREEQMGAYRDLLKEEGGYRDHEIDAMVEEFFPDEETSTPTGKEKKGNEGGGGDEKQYKDLAEKMKEDRLDLLKERLEDRLTETLDSDGSVGLFLKKVEELHGEEQVAKTRAALKDLIQEKALAAMARRMNEDPRRQYHLNFVKEDVRAGVKPALEFIRSVIGDVSKLGRAPETVTGEDDIQFGASDKLPEFNASMNPGDADKAAEAYLRGAFVPEGGGKSI